jgi:phosphoribosyl 1,2-cyclic phosphodiesterase
MRVTFWGARGTFPATGANFARYGGDTMCVEVMCGASRVVLGAGSGLRALGAKLQESKQPIAAHIVLSHLHLDHVMGLAQFAPLWRKDSCIVLHAAQQSNGGDVDSPVLSVVRRPLFPIDVADLPAAIGINEFRAGATFSLEPGIVVRTFALSRGSASVGILLEWEGRKLCHVAHYEHGDSQTDNRVAKAAEGADLLIYDAAFSDAEMAERRGLGHSSWEEGIRIKDKAGVGLLALAHHDPDRSDAHLDCRAEAAARRSANVFFARQGMSLDL